MPGREDYYSQGDHEYSPRKGKHNKLGKSTGQPHKKAKAPVKANAGASVAPTQKSTPKSSLKGGRSAGPGGPLVGSRGPKKRPAVGPRRKSTSTTEKIKQMSTAAEKRTEALRANPRVAPAKPKAPAREKPVKKQKQEQTSNRNKKYNYSVPNVKQYSYSDWKKMTRSQRERAGLPTSEAGAQKRFKRLRAGITGKDYKVTGKS